MRVAADQLGTHLDRQGLAPIHLIAGDEPLQGMEAGDAIRAAARKLGADRTVLVADKDFSWNQIEQESANLGLFASALLLEVRLGDKTPGKEGGEALSEFLARPPQGVTVLLTMDKLDKRMESSVWFKAVDKAGVITAIRPISLSKLPEWIVKRLKARGRKIGRDAAELIALRTEGNLLATWQEIEKLDLLVRDDEISVRHVQASVADSTRYDVFNLIEYAMRGNGARIVAMLRGLRQEGVEPLGIYGAIMWELRRLYTVAVEIEAGTPRDQVFQANRIWGDRQGAIGQVLRRFNERQLAAVLNSAIGVDRSLKGMTRQDPWRHLESFLFRMGGLPLPA